MTKLLKQLVPRIGLAAHRGALRTLSRFSIALMIATLSSLAGEARAGYLLSMTSTNSNAAPGGTGSFDLTLTNSSAATSSASVAAFSFDLSLPTGSGIKFTSVTEPADSSFIFFNNHYGLNPPGALVSDLEVTGSDLAVTGATTMNPGATFVLVHVTYSVDANASNSPVPITINRNPPPPNMTGGTFVTDGASPANDLLFTIGTGQITLTGVNPSPVPEPSALGMGATAAFVLGGFLIRVRRTKTI